MSNRYILKGHTPVLCEDIAVWGEFFGRSANRVVANTVHEGVRISTVFLGTDSNFDIGEPLLFESLVFGGEHEDECNRYHTWDEALAGHKEMVRRYLPEYDIMKDPDLNPNLRAVECMVFGL